MRKTLIGSFVAVAMVLGFAAGAGAQDDEPGTIVEIAQGDEQFSTLVSAVSAAGLVETLSGDGPFTVFAPTNAAFEALPAGTLDSLLEDPSGALTEILQLHVISGAVDSEAAIAAAGGTVDTLGGPITVELEGENLVVGGATVITADIEASNGVIHVIDAVITEPAGGSEAAQPAEDAAAADEAAPTPTRVDTGTGGLAAEQGVNMALLAMVAAMAALGVGTSAVALVRNRRDS